MSEINYIEKLKEKENKLINLEAQLPAKKKSIEDLLEKKKKADSEAQSLLGISLAEVPDKLEALKLQLKESYEKIDLKIKELEIEFENTGI